MHPITLVRGTIAAFASLTLGLVRADVSLHAIFTDHAVLQQGRPVPVWGRAAEGEKVTVEFAGQSVSTVAQDGRWSVRLKPLKASAEGRTLQVRGHNTVVRTDVVVGEVWVCSGQSNMEWPMSASFEPAADIAASLIRAAD